MNRRELLKLFGYSMVMAAPGVAAQPPPFPRGGGARVWMIDAIEGRSAIEGPELPPSRPCDFQLLRKGGGSIMSHSLNLQGGAFRWSAPPGLEIIVVAPDQPVEIRADRDLAWSLSVRRVDDRHGPARIVGRGNSVPDWSDARMVQRLLLSGYLFEYIKDAFAYERRLAREHGERML